MARRSISPRTVHGHRDRQRVTADELAGLSALELLDYFDVELANYMVPEETADPETADEQIARWGTTIDRIPDLYAWIARVHSIYDHLTDGARLLHGQGSKEYLAMRECRDASEAFQSVVKQRYQAASRMITIHYGERDESEMHRRR